MHTNVIKTFNSEQNLNIRSKTVTLHIFAHFVKQVRIHEISRSPARLCPPTKALPTDRRTIGPTDRRTDGRTHPLLESWLTTKKSTSATVDKIELFCPAIVEIPYICLFLDFSTSLLVVAVCYPPIQ